MSGIASLFGGSSAKRDRADVLSARSDLWGKVFGYALPEGQRQEEAGSGLTGEAGNYFSRLLRADRTETAQNAAPAINANLSAADAIKRREAITGTGRTGGTAEADRMAAADTQANTANIINDTMLKQRATGAEGTLAAGGQNMRQALSLLGLSDAAINQVLQNATDSRVDSQNIRRQTFGDVGADIGNIVAAFI